MTYEQIWAVWMLLALAVAAGLAIWAKHLRESKRLALREMIHRERMAALEKGVALPELPPDPAPSSAAGQLGRAALLGGLVLVFGGLGLLAALGRIPDTAEMGDLRDLASLGMLPIFIGFGLLLYTLLDRWSRQPDGEDEAP